MSNYNTLKTTINANIKQNGNQEITGQILNSVLNQMVTTLGAGYQFAGVATTATNPGTPDAKVFYIANGNGKYEKFGGLEVTEDEVVVLYYDTEWHKVATGIASQAKLAELEKKVIYDVTVNNNGAVFESLQALLSSSNLSTLIPTSSRYGGMIIRFVQSSDNKYVQYRYIGTSIVNADFTNVANWFDCNGNGAFIQEGTVYTNALSAINVKRVNLFDYNAVVVASPFRRTDYMPVEAGKSYFWGTTSGATVFDGGFKYYDKDKNEVTKPSGVTIESVIPSGVAYVTIAGYSTQLNNGKMFVESTVDHSVYIPYSTLNITTNDEGFNAAIKQIMANEFKRPPFDNEDIVAHSLDIDRNDSLLLSKYNIVDNSSNVLRKSLNPGNGALIDNNYRDVTDYIDVSTYKYITLQKSSGNVCLYDKDKNFISSLKSSTLKRYTHKIPANAYYIRLEGARGGQDYSVNAEIIANGTEHFISSINEQDIDVIKNKEYITSMLINSLLLKGSNVISGSVYNIIDERKIISGQLRDDGTFQFGTSYGMFISSFIPCSAGEVYYVFSKSAYDLQNTICWLNLYDADLNYLETLHYTEVETFTITNQNAAYFIYSAPKFVNRGMCVVKGEAPTEYRNYTTPKVAFTNDKYRRDLLTDILTYSGALKIMYSLLYPHLYGKKWAALGDSLTDGTGTSPYVTTIGAMFNMNTINYGIIGSQIAQYSEGQTSYAPMCVRYADMADDADIITVMGGANDSYDNIGTMSDRQENGQYTLYSGCHRLFAGLCEKYAGKKIGVITSPQFCRNKSTDTEWGTPDINMEKNRAKAAAIKEVAHFYGLPVFDLFNNEGFSGYSNEERALFWQGDKLHLTQFGQNFIADKIAKWLMTI